MKSEIVSRSFGTHSGCFHADEVTACALLLLFEQIDSDKIIRTRDLSRLKTCDYVCDVGGVYRPNVRRFDHHQLDYHGDLSSAGMVLKYLKDEKIIEEKVFDYLNRSLVIGVDAVDNGRVSPAVGHCSFSTVIANFIPYKHSVEDAIMDKAFLCAVDFTYCHLKRLLDKFRYIQKCRVVIEREMNKNKEVMIFEESMPWLESFFELGGEEHVALFLIMPSGKQWKLRGIPPTYEKRMQVRLPLPQEWAGLIDKELKEKTKIEGAVFCHKERFISIWETREDALKALELIF